jgi:hypothetical protein
MKKKFNKKGYNKKRIQKPSRKEQLVELKKQPKNIDSWMELFDSELISFYEFNPEEETFNEACEKIRKKEKRKLN